MKKEIVDAIALLKAEGYAVIRREKIKTLESIKSVDDGVVLKFGKEPWWVKQIKEDLYHGLVDILSDNRICALTTAQTEGRFRSTTYRARLTVIPHEIETDPLLEAMRST